ncbi:hypothetical protein FACS1894217_05160 [Clostridia bacterium]|nr:hypothetical protein FACS1894217_05160 [Clostridia bacterium]
MSVIKQIMFSCSECGKQYDTEEKAKQCFNLHSKCYCEKQEGAYWGYGVQLIFKTGEIRRDVVYSNSDYDNAQYSQMTRITHCPYCGRRLVEDNKQVLIRMCGSCKNGRIENDKVYCKLSNTAFPPRKNLVNETCDGKRK